MSPSMGDGRDLDVVAADCRRNGRLEDAVDLYRSALAESPDDASLHARLGDLLSEQGALDPAVESYHRSLALAPHSFEVLNNLGMVLQRQCRFKEAYAAYVKALKLDPEQRCIHVNLGSLLCLLELYPEAIHHCLRALELDPSSHQAAYNLGVVLRRMRRHPDALCAFHRCLELRPDYAPAYDGIGAVLFRQGDVGDALACFRKALELEPANADAHYDLAQALLLQGNLADGWREFEWRRESTAFRGARREFAAPQWTGGPLEGRTLLLHAEQGAGDTLQFVRYIPLVERLGGRVLLQCPEPLMGVMRDTWPALRVLAATDPPPGCDLQCPLLSLPLAFQTTLENVPAAVPYLKAVPAKVRQWEERLANDLSRRKIGLVWAGNPRHSLDAERSMPGYNFSILGGVPHTSFYSLQMEHTGEGIQTVPELKLIDLTRHLRDFSDTAAFVANLDLVISVDTAVAHLAGALGKPVWMLLPSMPDWRWLLGREDTPWYPTARLFRQPSPGDWTPALARVSDALRRASSRP